MLLDMNLKILRYKICDFFSQTILMLLLKITKVPSYFNPIKVCFSYTRA